MGQTIAALGAVLAVAWLLRVLVRVSGLEHRLRSHGSGLRVQSSCVLGPRQRLQVVEVEGERLLLGVTEHQVTLLRRLPREAPTAEAAAPEESQASEPPAGVFGHRVRRWAASVGLSLAIGGVLLLAGSAGAQSDPSPALVIPLDVEALTEPARISSTLEILAIFTFFSLAPSLLLMATCFTRVVIVLSLLRQAVGIQQLPPNQVIVGLALAITLFVMAPVGEAIRSQALDPYVAEQIDGKTASLRALAPMREFLLHHTRDKDLDLFVSLSSAEPPSAPEEVPLTVLLPSYVLSELRTAFEIGFTIFLPFLIVDLVIASMLISMQMIVLPPMLISLPFKIMLFVLVDGWNLLVSSLVTGLR